MLVLLLTFSVTIVVTWPGLLERLTAPTNLPVRRHGPSAVFFRLLNDLNRRYPTPKN